MEVRDVMCIFQMFCYLSFRSKNKLILILWIGLLVKYTKPKWLHTQYTSILFLFFFLISVCFVLRSELPYYVVYTQPMTITQFFFHSFSDWQPWSTYNGGKNWNVNVLACYVYALTQVAGNVAKYVFAHSAIGLLMRNWIQLNEIISPAVF